MTAVPLAALTPDLVRQLDGEGGGPDWDGMQAAIEARAREENERLEVERRAKLRRDLAEQGVPVKDIESVLEGELEESFALRAVTRWRAAWAEQHTPVLVMAGSLGVGKTTAAAWWICQPQEKHRYIRTLPALFVPAARLARWPKFHNDTQMSASQAALPPAIRGLFHAEALVIDDLGVELDDKSGAFLSFLDELIDCRYAGRLPTVVTSNVPIVSKDPKEPSIERRYGKRFMERVVVVGVKGESRRKRGHAK